MDLKQRKLNKSEWESIEVPESLDKIKILKLMIDSYTNVNNKINYTKSIFSFLKIEYNEKMEDYLYNTYLRNKCDIIEKKLVKINIKYKCIKIDIKIKIKTADKIRLEQNDDIKSDLYEFILINHIEKILDFQLNNEKMFTFHYFTLFNLMKNNILQLNRHVLYLCDTIIKLYYDKINIPLIIENISEFIEKNDELLKYDDLQLYEHQKEIFTICKNELPKLILYIAPTGTGKTLTPIALSNNYKIIFVCAARHVGLALAKSAISVNKKIAFAFGCASSADIRLHYFSAKEFTKDWKTGGIRKVDNTVGDNVEIMICDIKSYIPAMLYMISFNSVNKLLTFWDEPTITLDYENHDCHKIIKTNWCENMIPNMVLSSATLPKMHELTETISDFKNKFKDSEIYNIVSHDCKKTIPIINSDGYVVLPHYLNEDYLEIIKIALHCQQNLTLLRYFDLQEISEFIIYINKNNFTTSKFKIERYFDQLKSINMLTIKIYYITLLQNILNGTWGAIYMHFKLLRNENGRIKLNNTVDVDGNKITKVKSIGPGIGSITTSKELSGKPLIKLSSEQIIPTTVTTTTVTTTTVKGTTVKGTNGIYITTKDAYTLTDGPTIFITDDIEKIAKFYIQQANIPKLLMDDIMTKIKHNNILNNQINLLEEELNIIEENKEEAAADVSGICKKSDNKKSDSKKINREFASTLDNENDKSIKSRIYRDIENIRILIKKTTLDDSFIPNKIKHLKKWAEGLEVQKSFTSNIEENIVNEIMLLHGIEDIWKILLILGIGVLINHDNIKYTEIMKKLADEQKLYLIIASSDYIYGMNYQFCHAYLSKDLNLTQEKIIQAMGRVGRNNIQQTYSIRFRDNAQIMKLFTSDTEKPEIINMNKLFNSS